MTVLAPGAAGRIPLTVIGGFLGAGKTTLVNRLLRDAGVQRLAVLVNDFGAINIDASLVEARGADILALSNGCVCCQIGGDLGAALMRVLDRQPLPDAIVIEASGVADPWRIAQVGLADPALALDAVLVLVDAAALLAQAADPLLADTVLRQLKAADLLVLNKCDQVGATQLAALHQWLDAQMPGTPRFETTQAQVPAALLAAPALPRHAAAGNVQHGHGDPAHDDTSVTLDSPRHGELFDTWTISEPPVYRAAALRALLKAMPRGVLRLKGLVPTDEHVLAELQFAGRHGSLRAATPAVRQTPTTGVVAIGLRGALPAAALATALQQAALTRIVPLR